MQIAEDLAGAGRRVLLSTCQVGRFNWNYRGRETFRWLDDMRLLDPAPGRPTGPGDDAVRPSPWSDSGGRTLSLPMLAGLGVTLLGRLTDVVDGCAVFDGSGAANVAFGNQRWSVTCELIDAYIAAHGLDAAAYQEDEGGDDVPIEPIGSLHLGDADVSTVIWCTGFTGDLTYLDLPVLDASGQVRRQGSASDGPGPVVRRLPVAGPAPVRDLLRIPRRRRPDRRPAHRATSPAADRSVATGGSISAALHLPGQVDGRTHRIEAAPGRDRPRPCGAPPCGAVRRSCPDSSRAGALACSAAPGSPPCPGPAARTTRRSWTYQAGRASVPLRLTCGSDSAYRPTSSGVTSEG